MRSKAQAAGVSLAVAVYLLVMFGTVYGCVWNIVKLVDATTLTGLAVVRAVGIFVAPLGAVLGYL